MSDTGATDETVEEFRVRGRAWLAENMPPLEGEPHRGAVDWPREKELQQRLFAGGFAGICFPVEYGGWGLAPEYQEAFTEESLAYEMPFNISTPTLSTLGATLLAFGTEEQKAEHLPGLIRGEHLWVQLLSEPTGGSDLAGCLTSATPRGDGWVLNGSKIWTSGADHADFGICLARSDWDVPKHAGLSVFIVDLRSPGVTIEPIELANGLREFCQVFFDDVPLGRGALLGALDDGWAVCGTMLDFERGAAGGSSPYVSGFNLGAPGGGTLTNTAAELAVALAVDGDPFVRQLVGEHRVLDLVQRALVGRVTLGIGNGALTPAAGSVLRLFSAGAHVREDEIAMTIAGASGVAWASGDARLQDLANRYVTRQADALAGGSIEIQRNIVSERVLGLPREVAPDRGVPYREVRHGGQATSADG